MKKLVVIYGSGASYDSKYKIIISNNNEEIKFQLPMDNIFLVQNLSNYYYNKIIFML
jgi:hypothetical protein